MERGYIIHFANPIVRLFILREKVKAHSINSSKELKPIYQKACVTGWL